MSDYTPFKMNGSPFSRGGVQGTNSHTSALKKKHEEDINSLLDSRKELKAKRDKLEKPKEGEKKILLGNLRRKRNEKKIDENQNSINNNATAKKWKRDGDKKKAKTAPKKGLWGKAKGLLKKSQEWKEKGERVLAENKNKKKNKSSRSTWRTADFKDKNNNGVDDRDE